MNSGREVYHTWVCLSRGRLLLMTSQRLTHITEDGNAHMVDVSTRETTVRTATASGEVFVSQKVLDMLKDNTVPKGDVLATARIAGIMASKRTPDLIPLCHPIAVHGVEIDVSVDTDRVRIEVTVKTADRTGVEMEALTAVSVAALTVIDMIKALDPGATISNIGVNEKDGGRNGLWKRSDSAKNTK